MSEHTCPTHGGLVEDGFNPDFDLKQLILDPDSNMHIWGWLVSGFLTLGSLTIAAHSITRHLTHYYTPKIQRHKVRVLAYPPAYAILAWLTYLKYDYATVIMFFAKIVESFAVYNLFVCLQSYLEGYRKENDHVKVAVDTKVLGIYKFHLNSKWGLHFRAIIDILVFQFPIWNIIASFISIFAQIKGVYCDGQFSPHGAYLYLATISFISLSIILMALFTYLAVFNDEWKRGKVRAHGMFWCVKGPIMVIFYFGDILLSIMTYFGVIHDKVPTNGGTVWTAAAIKNGYYVLLICAVMVFVAALMERYFGLDFKEDIFDDSDKTRYGYMHAFADSFLGFIPHFFIDLFSCGGETVELAKKRIKLHKQRRLSDDQLDLLGAEPDAHEVTHMDDPSSLSQPARAHQSKVYVDPDSARLSQFNSIPLEPLNPAFADHSYTTTSVDRNKNETKIEMTRIKMDQGSSIDNFPIPPLQKSSSEQRPALAEPQPSQATSLSISDQVDPNRPKDHFSPHEGRNIPPGYF
ncbi:organic solute transporter Ostalpha-domain-containing protein [Phycomyces blakesleeanus]|uniref:DUF300-domain-containing protein n=2 Tax=Phycomyces blakesleeanus TaxID=4837 RepID=A0A167QCY9_PHYB8|nr:hypothetical protein PHYBLDRAFT_184789 [Phycomyces blakesleeanus NRRL 1555(-)]OAD79507.1 hypothetical protein PHYBLDRAFT_184789 [Phycomyces blakesleeanus NRRL 1555(-)]|eukprot:XP_018297547.1 hypothetical protein PHYBLDRAFT_184789 [Phycomyces blakesleeanus NRRL 1555(-)]